MTEPEAIEGVTLESYARLAVALHGRPPEEWDAIAQEHGVPPGRFREIADAWYARLGSDPSLAVRYNEHYQAAMVAAGIEAPDLTLEQYVEILRTGGPTPENLARYDMDVQQFSMVSHRWTQRMGSDPEIARRVGELFQGG